MCTLAMHHGRGKRGLPVDEAKCIDLLREAAGLGFPDANFQLGKFHHNGEMGFEQNMEEAIKYCKKAAECGHVIARHNLGCAEDENNHHVAAMRHLRLAASGGYRKSMNRLIDYFENGLLRHVDVADTLRGFSRSRAEMKSEYRDQYISYLKRTGEYEEYMEA